MDTDTGLRARFAETLRKLNAEVRDIDALTFATHQLTDGIMLTGDPEEMGEAADALEAAACLTRIAQRQARYLYNEIEEEIARVDVTSDDDPPEGSAMR